MATKIQKNPKYKVTKSPSKWIVEIDSSAENLEEFEELFLYVPSVLQVSKPFIIGIRKE